MSNEESVFSLLDYKFRRKIGYIIGPIAIAIGITLLVLFIIYHLPILLIFSIISFLAGISLIIMSAVWMYKWRNDVNKRIKKYNEEHPYTPPKKAHAKDGAEIHRGFIEKNGSLDIFEDYLEYFYLYKGNTDAIQEEKWVKGKYVEMMQRLYDEIIPLGVSDESKERCRIQLLTWNSALDHPAGHVTVYLNKEHFARLKSLLDEYIDDKRFMPEFLSEY